MHFRENPVLGEAIWNIACIICKLQGGTHHDYCEYVTVSLFFGNENRLNKAYIMVRHYPTQHNTTRPMLNWGNFSFAGANISKL